MESSIIYFRIVRRISNALEPEIRHEVPALGQWCHVAGSYDYTSGLQKLWVNGQMVASKNLGSIELETRNDARSGASQGNTVYYKGRITELRVYNRALTKEEIVTAMTSRALLKRKGNLLILVV